jgi:hypothetical protein
MASRLRQVLPKHFAIDFTDADARCNRVLNGYEESLFLDPAPHQLVALPGDDWRDEMSDAVCWEGTRVRWPHWVEVAEGKGAPAPPRMLLEKASELNAAYTKERALADLLRRRTPGEMREVARQFQAAFADGDVHTARRLPPTSTPTSSVNSVSRSS